MQLETCNLQLLPLMPYLGDIVAMLCASVLIAYVCQRIRLVPIVGFILAGVVIGPYALRLVEDQQVVRSMAEVGVILLLFSIGVELSLEKMARIRTFIFKGGALQSGTLVLITLVLLLGAGLPWRIALFTGFLVVLSSTAIVLKLLTDRGETDTPAGQVSLALLIFQDLAMVGMVLLVPALSERGGGFLPMIVALLKAALIIAFVLVLARKAIPWVLEQVARARGRELFLLTVMAMCFGTAWLTSLAGVSLAFGAFLSGLVVSESRYSGYALSEILPLRTIFNAVFFVSIGMLLDLSFLSRYLPMVLGLAVLVFVLKSTVTMGTVLALGYPVRVAAVSGLALAQICETSFVLERAGADVGLTPLGLGYTGEQAFVAVTVVLMILTPFFVQAGHYVGGWLEATRIGRYQAGETRRLSPVIEAQENHVVVIGYGPAGRRLVKVLKAAQIPFVVVELNPLSIRELERDGIPVLYGDASRPHILEMARIEQAKLCVVVINDPAAAVRAVGLARFMNPTLQIVTRARFLSDVVTFEAAGADVVVPEELETSVRIFTHVLDAYLVPAEQIHEYAQEVREQARVAHHRPEAEGDLKVLEGLGREGLQTRTIRIREGAVASEKSLVELALRQQYGLTVLAVHRNGRTIGSPAGDFTLAPDDRVVLFGTADQFAMSAHLFRTAAA